MTDHGHEQSHKGPEPKAERIVSGVFAVLSAAITVYSMITGFSIFQLVSVIYITCNLILVFGKHNQQLYILRSRVCLVYVWTGINIFGQVLGLLAATALAALMLAASEANKNNSESS